MNILYLINHAGKGGSEKYVLTLTQKLQDRASVFFVYNEHGPLCREMEPLCKKSARIEMRHPFDIRAARELARFLRTNAIDIVHAQYPRENYIAILAKFFCPKIKIVYTAHWNTKDTKLRSTLNLIFTHSNALALAVGTECAALLRKNGYPKNRIRTIFPGVDLPENTAPRLSADIVNPENSFIFTCVSRLSEEKGLDFLLQSAAELKKLTDKPFSLLIAGDGNKRAELETLTDTLGLRNCVTFLGYRNDISAVLSNSGAYVNPSRTESFGFATVEALAHSLPVAATDTGGSRDILNPDCGILVPFGDCRAFALAMNEIMNNRNLYESRSANARKTAETRFSNERFADETFSAYKDVLRNV